MSKPDPKKLKTRYSPEVGKAKRDLYQSAHRRIIRCIKIGAHIEAITLIESIMSDRIESCLAAYSKAQVEATTLGSLVSKIDKIQPMGLELKSSIYKWNKDRAYAVHHMVKLTNDYSSTWIERMAFARSTAKDGLIIMKNLRKFTDAVNADIKKGKL